MTCQFTAARTAAWAAIDGWTWPTGFVWARKFRSDADQTRVFLRAQPHAHEIPGLCLGWGTFSPQQVLQVLHKFPAVLVVKAWLPGDQLTLAETILDQLPRCLSQSAPSGSTVPYVRAAIGHLPEPLGPLSMQLVTYESLCVWELTASIGLPIYTDLYHAGSP